MARKQLPPKPEESIKKLDDKFTEFREETLLRLTEIEKLSENTNTDLKEAKETTGEDFGKLREALEIKLKMRLIEVMKSLKT
jgi:hypothetical protein